LSDAKAQVSYDCDTGRITTFLISTQHQEDTSVMDIRLLVEAVMETAGKIKNDNMSDQDFYKLQFAEEYMGWLNIFGLIIIAVIMIPNIIFAIRCKEGFENKWSNKFIEVAEQIGRFGCFGFMIINIPGTWFGWWSDEAFAIYLIVDTILVVLYCAIWTICFKKSSIFRALALSVIPSVLFLFSGIMSRSVLLLIAAILFAPSHILLSYKNAK
jgi:hypothetical protein